MSKTVSDENNVSTIALGVEIVGEINANGSFRVVGKIKGNLKLTGKLVVDDTGVIEGDVVCKNATIAGKLDGKIVVEELLQLTSSARVHGEIITSKLAIEDGAIFTGSCNMDKNESQALQVSK
ncbi:MAG: polymer-forming cytoskeletal protein [Bacteroidales bacterium]|nr:polymer-forming cytoskeletal protein [Bacteroidales bacterium]